jgi:hypothetical protein
MNYTVSCIAQPNSDFSPFFFLFHLSRYRPRRYSNLLVIRFSQKGIFATTVHIMTNITSFDIDLLVFDGLIASYLGNVILKSPYDMLIEVPNSSQLDHERVMWGTRLQPIRSAVGSSDVYLNIDMGYFYPKEHHYQTLVLYNRNPVASHILINSPQVPGISLTPIYRALLTNQTLTDNSSQSSIHACSLLRLVFTLPANYYQLAPWEYLIFLLDVTADIPSPELSSYHSQSSSIPSITTYNYSTVISMENEIQRVEMKCGFDA